MKFVKMDFYKVNEIAVVSYHGNLLIIMFVQVLWCCISLSGQVKSAPTKC
jgi:hypothetical protein